MSTVLKKTSTKKRKAEPAVDKAEREECNSCGYHYTSSLRVPVVCNFCEFKCCVPCVQKYVLSKALDAHCMSCRNVWSNSFLYKNFSKAFVHDRLNQHRLRVLLSLEKSLLPLTMEELSRERLQSYHHMFQTLVDSCLQKAAQVAPLMTQVQKFIDGSTAPCRDNISVLAASLLRTSRVLHNFDDDNDMTKAAHTHLVGALLYYDGNEKKVSLEARLDLHVRLEYERVLKLFSDYLDFTFHPNVHGVDTFAGFGGIPGIDSSGKLRTLGRCVNLEDVFVGLSQRIHNAYPQGKLSYTWVLKFLNAYNKYLEDAIQLCLRHMSNDAKESVENRMHKNKRCMTENCFGYLQLQPGQECATLARCKNCFVFRCNNCFEKFEHGRVTHTCDPQVLRSIQMISQTSKPCPKCKTHIEKVSGCDQMFCTNCTTAFDWVSGDVIKGRIHNPHFFEWRNRQQHQNPTTHTTTTTINNNNNTDPPCDPAANNIDMQIDRFPVSVELFAPLLNQAVDETYWHVDDKMDTRLYIRLKARSLESFWMVLLQMRDNHVRNNSIDSALLEAPEAQRYSEFRRRYLRGEYNMSEWELQKLAPDDRLRKKQEYAETRWIEDLRKSRDRYELSLEYRQLYDAVTTIAGNIFHVLRTDVQEQCSKVVVREVVCVKTVVSIVDRAFEQIDQLASYFNEHSKAISERLNRAMYRKIVKPHPIVFLPCSQSHGVVFDSDAYRYRFLVERLSNNEVEYDFRLYKSCVDSINSVNFSRPLVRTSGTEPSSPQPNGTNNTQVSTEDKAVLTYDCSGFKLSDDERWLNEILNMLSTLTPNMINSFSCKKSITIEQFEIKNLSMYKKSSMYELLLFHENFGMRSKMISFDQAMFQTMVQHFRGLFTNRWHHELSMKMADALNAARRSKKSLDMLGNLYYSILTKMYRLLISMFCYIMVGSAELYWREKEEELLPIMYRCFFQYSKMDSGSNDLFVSTTETHGREHKFNYRAFLNMKELYENQLITNSSDLLFASGGGAYTNEVVGANQQLMYTVKSLPFTTHIKVGHLTPSHLSLRNSKRLVGAHEQELLRPMKLQLYHKQMPDAVVEQLDVSRRQLELQSIRSVLKARYTALSFANPFVRILPSFGMHETFVFGDVSILVPFWLSHLMSMESSLFNYFSLGMKYPSNVSVQVRRMHSFMYLLYLPAFSTCYINGKEASLIEVVLAPFLLNDKDQVTKQDLTLLDNRLNTILRDSQRALQVMFQNNMRTSKTPHSALNIVVPTKLAYVCPEILRRVQTKLVDSSNLPVNVDLRFDFRNVYTVVNCATCNEFEKPEQPEVMYRRRPKYNDTSLLCVESSESSATVDSEDTSACCDNDGDDNDNDDDEANTVEDEEEGDGFY